MRMRQTACAVAVVVVVLLRIGTPAVAAAPRARVASIHFCTIFLAVGSLHDISPGKACSERRLRKLHLPLAVSWFPGGPRIRPC